MSKAMHAHAAPTLEASVSPELRQLLHGWRVQRSRAAPGAAEPRGAERTVVQEEAETEALAPWRQFSLRRDGARPFRFSGDVVLEVRSARAPALGYLRIFATSDGEAVAHLVYSPPESLPARPVFRVARVDTAEALHRFVSDTGPEQCFLVHGALNAPVAHGEACDMLRLPLDFPALAAPAGNSSQSTEGTPE